MFRVFLILCCIVVVGSLASFKESSSLRIAIIPGHGGHDPGAVNPLRNIKEKDLNLLTAEFLAQRLERLGHKVKICRTGDTYVSVYEMQRRANHWSPDITFVIHYNASPEHQESGWEVYYTTEKSARLAALTAKAMMLHLDIQPHYAPIKPASAEVFRRPYNCLKLLQSPAVLTEGGFIDHSLDAQWLEDGGWLQVVDALTAVVDAWGEKEWVV